MSYTRSVRLSRDYHGCVNVALCTAVIEAIVKQKWPVLEEMSYGYYIELAACIIVDFCSCVSKTLAVRGGHACIAGRQQGNVHRHTGLRLILDTAAPTRTSPTY